MKMIKLIGIEGDDLYESWETSLSVILQDLKIDYNLEKVNDIDSIIQLKTNAIPAVIIDDRILLEQNGSDLDPEVLKSSILNYLNQTPSV